VALVSGAASGIGRAAALMMAGAGARVAVAGLRVAECEAVADEIAAAGGRAVPIALDVRSPDSAAAAVATTLQAFGRLDAVFNPAGILRQASVASCTPEDWDEVVAVHAAGHAHILAAAIPAMRRQGGGRLITVSSGAAIDGIGELAAYATAKSAILGMTRALAVALVPDGIAVNAISPTAYTPMSRDAPPGEASAIPARYRRRDAEQVAAFVAYLASGLAEGITGRLFMVSGGHTIEFDPPRPLKQIQLAGAGGVAELAQDLAWVQRRPTSLTIGRRPTRDYFLLPERPDGPVSAFASAGPAGGAVLTERAPDAVVAGLIAAGLTPAEAGEGGGAPVGAVVFPPAIDGAAADVASAWAAVGPAIRAVFLSLQRLARCRPKTIVVALPPYAAGPGEPATEMLSAGLLGLARSAASALAPSGVAVHAVHAPAERSEAPLFALLAAALMRSEAVAPGGLFAAADGHVVSFAPEMPAWQHFGDQDLTEGWLTAIAAAVASRGRVWSRAA
jgi:NAD(P)-dependent dehydrogenase (short-subunit alcohol dehydrogenase family)